MARESSDDGLAADDGESDFVRLRQRTWMAAAPYLGAAGLAWVGAAFAQYKLNQTYGNSQPLPGGARLAILQILAEALLYAGLGLFTVGLLVVVLRQHEHWRHRDRVGSFGDMPDVEDGVTVRDPFGSPVDVTPSFERQLRDPAPDHPDWPHR